MERSIVLTPLIPAAETDIEWFERGVKAFAEAGTTVVEYYTDESLIPAYQKILEKYGQKGIYLHAVRQKRQGINLSAIDQPTRRSAVDIAASTAKICAQAGVTSMLITSGARPEDPENLSDAMGSLKTSLRELLDAVNLPLVLEPGDTEIHMCQTIGSTPEVIHLMQDLHHPGLMLTMDSSHIAQLGEDVRSALRQTATWCRHVHLANCVLKPGHPLYGDRHPFFVQEGSVFTSEALHEIMTHVPEDLGTEDFILSVEVISSLPGDESISRMMKEASWFFS